MPGAPRSPARPKRAGGCLGTAGRRGSGPVRPARALICRGRSGRGHCVGSSHVRGGGGAGGGKEACGGAWAPGVRERVWGWGVWPNQGLCSWTLRTLGVGGGTGGHRTPPGPKKLWQDWAGLPHRPLPLPQGILAPLLGRTLPEPTFLGAHFPPPTPTPTPISTSPHLELAWETTFIFL